MSLFPRRYPFQPYTIHLMFARTRTVHLHRLFRQQKLLMLSVFPLTTFYRFLLHDRMNSITLTKINIPLQLASMLFVLSSVIDSDKSFFSFSSLFAASIAA